MPRSLKVVLEVFFFFFFNVFVWIQLVGYGPGPGPRANYHEACKKDKMNKVS
jgi:hypothetical protein